jgi:hypothetical protein
MQAMCRRALKIGLPALAFTEHLDITGWVIDPEDLLDHLRPLLGDDGLLTPDPLDMGGYLDSIDRCRRQFPELRADLIADGPRTIDELSAEVDKPVRDADRAESRVDCRATFRSCDQPIGS